MGGMIGQTLALKAPQVFASLSLCDTSSRIPAEARPAWQERIRTAESQGMEPLVEPTLARWFTEPFRDKRKDVVGKVAAMIRSTPPAGYAGCCHAISALDLTDRISAIKVPTIAIVGEDDPGTPVAAHKVIHERIAGSRLEIIPKAAHLSNMEQPDLFNKALTGFLFAQLLGGLDLDEAGVEGAGAGGRGHVRRQHVHAPARVLAAGVERKPRALLDRHHAGRDAVGDAHGEHGGAATVEDAHALAVGDGARGGVGGVHPHVVAIGAGEQRLVVVDGVRARA
jgi:hypothetical protein